jgi:hypothetical protein
MRDAVTHNRTPEMKPSATLWTPKVIALTAIGFIVTILLIMGTSNLVRHRLKPATWEIAAGAALILVFSRHRRIALALNVLAWLLVMAGPIALVKPTLLGITVTFSSGTLLLALTMWLAKKYPEANRGDLKKFFDRDPE